MTRCTFKQGNYNCGSYAFNLYKEDIDQGSYCDRHYWQDKAEQARAAEREACEKIQFELRERYISQNKTAQAEIMLLTAVYDYAAAIRARGQDPMPLFADWPGGWKK